MASGERCETSGRREGRRQRYPAGSERPGPEIARDAVAALKNELPFSSENMKVVVRKVVVQTLEVEPIRGLEVALDHAASTAFQISGAVLSLTRSLSSLN